MVQVEQSEEDQRSLLESRIVEANDIVDVVERQFGTVDGALKLKNRIKAELKFLSDLRKAPQEGLKKYIDTSNVVHFRGLVDAACNYHNCTAFYKSFTKPQTSKGPKLEVDLVVDGGAKWVKVVSRSARGLAMEYVGAGGGTSRSIVEQAQDYISMAEHFPHFFKTPEVIFEFQSGLPDRLAAQITALGITVAGNLIPINELVTLPEDSDDENEGSGTVDGPDGNEGSGTVDGPDDHPESGPSLSSEDSGRDGRLDGASLSLDKINLDVTAVFVLISSLTHPGGCDYHFDSGLLNAQAVLERKKPALAPLLNVIKGKKLIMCRSAYDSVRTILATVAGPEEKRRAKSLFESVEVVEDNITERANKLKISDKISPRSKVIFGSGDYYKAVTVSANRHFVSAAGHQGINFAVVLHESRALSEQKQLTARPL